MRTFKNIVAVALTGIMAVSILGGCSQTSSGTVFTDGSTSMEKVIGTLGEWVLFSVLGHHQDEC